MENIDISLSKEDLKNMVTEVMLNSIKQTVGANRKQLNDSVAKYFEKGFFNDKVSQFEKALNWAVEEAFRGGIYKAMIELDFEDLVAEKAKEVLSDKDFLESVAKEIVRKQLNLEKHNDN